MTTMNQRSLQQEVHSILFELGVSESTYSSGSLIVKTPLTGQVIAHVTNTSQCGEEEALMQAQQAFQRWRMVPAPLPGRTRSPSWGRAACGDC